jgi:hypothetical protein
VTSFVGLYGIDHHVSGPVKRDNGSAFGMFIVEEFTVEVCIVRIFSLGRTTKKAAPRWSGSL